MLWIKLKYIYYRFLYIINIILIINYKLSIIKGCQNNEYNSSQKKIIKISYFTYR